MIHSFSVLVRQNAVVFNCSYVSRYFKIDSCVFNKNKHKINLCLETSKTAEIINFEVYGPYAGDYKECHII
jgi:hypothetical protein